MSAESTGLGEAPLKVALFGAGAMARHHATALRSCRRPVELVAVADPDEIARAGLRDLWPDLSEHATVDELLDASMPEIVHVCTPPATHAELALRAARAGCHLYVEKPFAPTVAAAREILDSADERDLVACPGHQLLFERPTRDAERLRPALGEVIHLESYFSFRPRRTRSDGSAHLAPDDQLLDILPHPTYLLLHFLELVSPEATSRLTTLEVGRGGTVHAVVRRGDLTATLLVTLDGRPVESFVRLVGTNGTLALDYVRGITLRAIGPGSSGIDKLLHPYRQARQLAGGTTVSMLRRLRSRRTSYPGLVEIFDALHDSIERGSPGPVSRDNVLGTVELCAEVASAIGGPSASAGSSAGRTDRAHPQERADRREAGPLLLVTGGTGFIGREVVHALSSTTPAPRIRVAARRLPAPWEARPGVEYARADLGAEPLDGLLEGVDVVIHCAAATAGGWEAHRSSSVHATARLVKAAAHARVGGFVHVSSLAVLSKEGRGPVTETSPLESDGKRAGPYVWGKLQSERAALQLSAENELPLRIVRPAAVVDYRAFEPPGRLGRRIGNVFVAVGRPGQRMGVADARFVARAIAWIATHLREAPEIVNLIEPDLPTRGELVARLRERNPDLRVVWLPMGILRPLSWMATGLQRLFRPGKPPIDVRKVFLEPAYDTRQSAELASALDLEGTPVPTPGHGPHRGAPEHASSVDREDPCAV